MGRGTMRNTFRLLAGVTAVLTMGTVFVGAADANPTPSSGTDVTFTVLDGSINISTPEFAVLGSQNMGPISAPLGQVAVTDTRRSAEGTWTATVVASDFVGAQSIIPADAAQYWSGPATGTTGDAVFTPGQLTAVDAVTLGSAEETAFSVAGATAVNVAKWAPTLVIVIPNSALADTYDGTITHSVA